MIPADVRLIDVGCDHAYLDIYLANKYPTIECLATDVNANALSSAIKHLEKKFKIPYDQRGAGKTYMRDKEQVPDMSMLLEDLHQTVEYVKEK